MRWRKAAVWVVVAGIAAVVVWRAIPNDRARIRRSLEALKSAIDRKPGETGPGMVLKRQRLEGLLADRVTIEVPERDFAGTYSGRDLANEIFRYRLQCETLTLRFLDASVRLTGPDEAEVDLTATLEADAKSGWRETGLREVMAYLRKVDNRWVFYRFRQIEMLEK